MILHALGVHAFLKEASLALLMPMCCPKVRLMRAFGNKAIMAAYERSRKGEVLGSMRVQSWMRRLLGTAESVQPNKTTTVNLTA